MRGSQQIIKKIGKDLYIHAKSNGSTWQNNIDRLKYKSAASDLRDTGSSTKMSNKMTSLNAGQDANLTQMFGDFWKKRGRHGILLLFGADVIFGGGERIRFFDANHVIHAVGDQAKTRMKLFQSIYLADRRAKKNQLRRRKLALDWRYKEIYGHRKQAGNGT